MDDDQHREVIRHLFTVAGTQLETATESAGAGQAADLPAAQMKQHAHDVILAAQALAALGDAIVLLADAL